MPLVLSVAGWTSLLVLIFRAVGRARFGSVETSLGWKWWSLVAVALFCFRAPLLGIAHELNPDEGQLIAGAITFKHEPVFWRAIDTYTAGPLVTVLLLPAAWAKGLDGFLIARALALGAEFAGLLLVGEALARLKLASPARAAVLPPLTFLAFTTTPDFLFHSSEIAPCLLLAVAVFLIAGQTASPSRGKVIWLGLILGSVPWAKLQGGPIAAVLWAITAGLEWHAGRKRWVPSLLIASLVPALVVFASLTLTHQVEHFGASWRFNNSSYLKAAIWTLTDVCGLQWANAVIDGYLASWIAGGAVFAFAALSLGGFPSEVARSTAAIAIGLCCVALACVLTPLRPFTHYLHFLITPWTLATAGALAVALSPPVSEHTSVRARLVVVLFLVLCLAPQLARRLNGANAFEEANAAGRSRTEENLIRELETYTAPGESLAIWGWRSSLYVETGLRQATRFGQTEAQLHDSPYQAYLLRRFLADLIAARPPVFVDAVGPGNFMFMDRRFGHEVYPDLGAYIRREYALTREIGGTRVYVRNDRLAAVGSRSSPFRKTGSDERQP